MESVDEMADVNISFGTAAKLAHALALDFSPTLTLAEERVAKTA